MLDYIFIFFFILFYLFIGCTVWLARSQFSDQGLNLAVKAPNPNREAIRELHGIITYV